MMNFIFRLLTKLGYLYSRKSRKWRAELFNSNFHLKDNHKILDLGSGTGNYFFQFVKPNKNVFISDINPNLLKIGNKQFGYKTHLIDATKPLPFKNNHFDIIFCNSLIEHTTGDKKKILNMSNKEFKKYASTFQRQLAQEIRRVGKFYFVQTPYKYFPIESHTWLPILFIFLPRSVQIRVIIYLNRYWPKKTYPDWNLLTITQMQDLFPDAHIILEKSFGLVKSIIAVKK